MSDVVDYAYGRDNCMGKTITAHKAQCAPVFRHATHVLQCNTHADAMHRAM